MGERPSEYARDADDWYVEPSWCVSRLFDWVPFVGAIHDPCCGMGTIVDAALSEPIAATGADLHDRANGRFPCEDFFADEGTYQNIVTNPPYSAAQAIIETALLLVRPGGRVAALVQGKFLFSQGRHRLFTRPEMERVLVFSRRPSMPPGALLVEKGEACRGGGSIDFIWAVWRVGKTTPGCTMEWVL